MKAPRLHDRKGFTLVEMLLVMGMMGLIMAAVYSVYLVHQKTAYSSEEVAEVQQSLRIAVENITRDFQMAGMMVPAGTAAVTGGYSNYSTAVSVNTASAEGLYARVTNRALVSGNTYNLTLEEQKAVDPFAANDRVRIIRPQTMGQPIDTAFTVVSVDRNNSILQVSGITSDSILPGDILAKTTATAAHPNTIEYFLVNAGTTVNGFTCPSGQRCLVRSVNGVQDIIATNLSSLRFSYISGSTEETAPSDVNDVRAVRVTIKGQTSATVVLSGGAKTRQVETVVKFRNRK